MIKQIKRYGNSTVIVLDKQDMDWFNLSEGDWIDIGDIDKVIKENDTNN